MLMMHSNDAPDFLMRPVRARPTVFVPRFLAGWTALIAVLIWSFWGPLAEAVQIKRIQSGIANFDTDDVVQAINLTYPVDQSKSIILLSTEADSISQQRDQNWFFVAQFEDNNTIDIERGGGTSGASVSWQVIEFVDGVSVQRGISSLQPTDLNKTITIPMALDTSGCTPITFPCHAVPIVMTKGAFTSQNQTHQLYLLPSFIDNSNLRVERFAGTGTKATQIVWQVIEFLTDTTVYTGIVSLPVPGTAATNQTATNNGLDPDGGGPLPVNSGPLSPGLSSGGANALLFTSFTGGSGIAGWDNQIYARGTVTSGTTITFTRGYASTNTNSEGRIRYHVVDLIDGISLVQKGTHSWGGGTGGTPARIAISSSTDATPIMITTSAAHGLSTGDLINVSGHSVGGSVSNPVNGNWHVLTGSDCSPACTSTQLKLSGSASHGLGAGGTTGYVLPAQKTASLTAVRPSRTLVLGAATTTATGSSNTTRDYADDLGFAVELLPPIGAATTSTTFASVRSGTNQSIAAAIAADVQYFVTEFTPLTVKSPNGSEVWKVGESHNITWKHAAELESSGTCNSAGPAHRLKIELSTNGGSTYPLGIASDVCANLDTIPWTIPASIGATDLDVSTLRVKITDLDLLVRNSDVSNADFTVKGTLTVTSPNTAVSWFVGDSCPGANCRTITWGRTGNLDDNGTVTLKLYTASGTTFDSTIATGLTPSVGTYNWTPVPDKIRTDLRVGAELSSDASGVNDQSDIDFSIKGRITVTTPNGPQSPNWETLKTYNITWTSTGTLPPTGVNIYYSKNSGGSYAAPNGDTIVTAASATGTYAWTIPTAAIGSFSRIKVEQNGDATTFDESDADFTIVASIVVDSPNSGTEVWLVGTTQNITWTINGTGVNNVKLEYSSTGCGGTYTSIVASTLASAGSFPWTIPDAIGGNTCVKISNVDAPAIFDTSNNVFRIKGAVQVTSPNGSDVFPIGSSRNITWNNNGTVSGTVEIRYSTDGGSTYPNVIVASTPIGGASGSYSWSPIPDVTGGINNTVKVRVIPSDTVNVADDASDSNFSIKGTVVLGAPNGGGTCTVGQSCPVSWTKTGSIGNVELHYSTDGGATFPAGKLIATGLDPVSGTPYNWATPDDIDSDIRVRVRLVTDTSVEDQSDANFSIKGTLTLVAPNNGEVWKVGETNRNITWTRVGTTGSMAGNVELRYSTNGGTSYDTLINSTTAASALSYNWNPIPDAIETQLRVKVTLVTDTTVFDTSDANFTIKGQLTVTQPNTNLIWFVGDTTRNITWNTNGTVSGVKLYYATDGATFSNPIAGGASISNVGSYNWNPVPDIIGTNVKVRLENAADSTVYDDSDTGFTVKGTLTLTAPNGSQSWVVGDTQNITWTKTGTLSGNVKLLYSTDGGATYPDPGNMITNSVAVTAGSYAWTVPDAIDNDLRVKIVYLNETSVTDESDANFTIQGSLNITFPDGGEVWELGTSQNITWNLTGTVGAVKLEYSTDGGSTYPNLIIASTPSDTDPPTGGNNGQYAWTIPSNAPLSTTARVRITPVTAGKAAANASENNFRLKGKLTITAPNGGQTWVVADPQNITWTTLGAIANAKLEYSTDSGSTWPAGNVIVSSTPAGAGSYTWIVADGISAQCRIRISDASDASVIDASDADFTIRGSLALTAPNGGQSWVVGTTQNITWTKTGTLPNVKLEYSTNSGVSYTNLIVASTSGGNLSYPWTIPDSIGTTRRVKVTYDTTPDVLDLNDTSDADFTIRGSITVTAPNGNEGWPINATQNITWVKTGTLTGNLKLEYSTDGGTTYPVGNLISNTVPATDTSYAWTVPDNPTTQGRVRITQLDDTNVTDPSDANFSIKGSLFIQAPDGGEVWKVSESRNITWTRGGSIANAKLDLSKDGGATFPIAITASTPAANLSYAWTLPDEIDTDLRVRITDVNDNTVTDASNGNFTIKGTLTLGSPNGGETWIVNDSRNITWAKTGTIPNVKLEYSTNGGTTYPNVIVSSTAGSSLSFAWTIPDSIGTQLRVRITNVDDVTVTDDTNANFTIKGSVTLTAPNGGETWIVGSSQNVTWTKQGSIANVKLEYSKNGFADELQTFTIVASTPAAPLSYAWTIADAIGAQLKVRVSDASDSTVNDVSNTNFTIKGALTLTAPNGAELWTVNSSRAVTWTRTGSITNVKLEYSTNSGSTYPNLITASTDAATGTYAWTLPDAITATAKVRVSDTSDATVQDESNAVFKIVGVLTLTAPNGGEKWTVGNSQNVTWTRIGSIANAKLEYSTDGGTTYPNLIVATTVASSLSYAWTIPNTPSATVKVKVSDVDFPSDVSDVSDANFKIKAGLTLTAPNGGEVLTVGSAQNITWTTVGTAANVKLEYSADGGSTYPNVITASASNSGSYSWTVADAISTTVRVKVSDAADTDAFDTSDVNFKIRGSLLLTAPNGGEGWQINTVQNITWTRTGSLPNVKLEYSTNGFSDELQTYVITASAPADPPPVDNNGLYAWTIPNTPSATVKLRVSDASDATVSDLSNANLSIKGSVTLTAPNGSEVWVVGATQNVTWNVFGAITNVKLQYSTDGGATWPAGNLITASTSANTDPPVGADNGQYSWTIPDVIGTQLRVRVSDAADASVFDDSDANFKIRGSITVSAPNGGETWIVGASQNIAWTRTGSFANVKLEYSTNGFSDELQTFLISASAPASPLNFAWTVPDAIGTTLKVRASDAADITVVDISNAHFEIKGSLTVTSPNGVEVWKVGESRNITWTKTGTIATVKLEYSTNGGTTYPNIIASSTSATSGSYTWSVPDAIGTQLRVKITHTGDATVNDASNANFEIKGQIALTSPNGGEVWIVGTSQNITWTKQGTFATVKLEYSTDGGSTYPTVISASADAVTGTPYAWTIPDAIGTQLRVNVTSNADTTVNDASDANFKIVGSLTLIAPNGSEAWAVGTSQNVSWTKVGSITNVKLEYSTNGGTSYPNLITASTGAGTGIYAWTIPDAISATVRLKVTDASDSTVYDTSNADFKVMGGFVLTSPNGGEVWAVGESRNITWTTAGSVVNVKLEYSTDGGATYPNLIIASTSNTGTYAWTVPDAISTTVKVRISDASDANAFDVSNGNFKIRGSLLLISPNGGEAWPISTTQNVTWSKMGSIANVKLEYSTDGGATYPNLIIASVFATSGTPYAWTIPDAPATTVKVRVSDVSDSTVFDESNANFKIQGLLTITAPNGGEVWIVGSSYNITWTKFGSILNVKLQYSTDGGITWPDPGKVIIASTAAATLSYTWTIPDDISNTVKVRITDTGDTSVFDDSNANLGIKGSLTVTAPNGGEIWVVADTQNITWTKTGTIPNVKLEYSKNGFADELQTFLITASVPSTPSAYAWTIPDAISNTVKVRLSNVSDPTVSAVSNAYFAIKGSLTLNAPNGGETWIVGASQPITWSKVGSIANVKLEYSSDGGVSYPDVILASTSASAGSYSWTIPDAITTTARVKVTDVSDSSVFDISNTNFKIAGSLTVTAANGAEAWLIATTQNITWTRTGSIANVKLEYSTNGGTSYPNLIVASVSATTGTPYAWVIPDTPTTQAKIKVTNTADSSVYDESNANFNIRGSVTLSEPNGSEVWVVGESRAITWMRTGSFPNVELRYSTDGGTTYPSLITASTSAGTLSYAWIVPDALSTGVRVKITDTGDSAVTDVSDANFKIKGSVTLTSPNGAEVWIVGASRNITWTRTGSFANVKLEYSTDGGTTYLNLITASAPAAPLSYAWTIPDAINTSLKVKISDENDATVVDVSDANFTIKASLTLNAPNGGETWIVGSSQNITWAKTGTIVTVKLEYSTDGGSTYPNVITLSSPAAALSYVWSIPDTLSSTVRVKITHLTDATVNDTSNGNFKIAGSFTLTAPDGGEVWIVGATQNITWTKTGSIATARLDYSTDGGVSYPSAITSSVSASALSFAWTTPDNMSSTVKVKITDTSDSTVFDASNGNFKIAGSFTLLSPNGGEKWPAGSTQSITWTKTGSMVNAKLEYSTDGGTTYPNLIVATTPASALSYAWVLGTTTSTQVRVRITDVSDSTVFDASNANFKIMGGFVLSSPNGGEVWVVGETRNITWTTVGNVANVKLSYSVNGGTTYPNAISASTTNTGSYAWTIPDAIGTTLRVKVEDVLDPDAYDESNANFKIKGSLTLSSPNGGEIWTVESNQNISWTKAGSIANVKLEYSTDGGTTYPVGSLIATSLNATTGTPFAWTIPDAISTTVKVKVTDVTDATVYDESNASFTIRGSFNLTAPNGGEKWTVGTTQSILWSTFGTIPNVRLEYSTDGGSSYPNVITAASSNTGSYNWTIPNAITTTMRLRVSNAADAGTFDASDADFKVKASFAMTAPDGGEVLVVGVSQGITWTTAGTVANVKLEYSTNGGTTYPNGIATSAPNTGTFAWTVPDAISATVRIRVSDVTDTVDAFDTSNGNFKIRAGFTVTAPNGGEAWTVGSVQNITWISAGTVANVKLEYSTDGGATYPSVVASSIANIGTYAWTIPDAITTAARLKVSDVNDTTASDASNTNFKIQGFLRITAPNGGEKWTVGSVRTVTWDRNGSIPFVKLEFSTNGGGLYAPITASTSNTGSFAWAIPDNISTNCLVKVSDTNDATVNDASDVIFKIQAGFTVTAPNGGEVWAVGSARTITWLTNGTVSFVKIDYSTDSGSSFPNLITSSTSNTGSYGWTVPDNVTGSVRVRVSQTTDAEAFDTSDGDFRIRVIFTLTSPNGAEQWRVGQVQNITWGIVGTIPNVKLQYSRDGFNADLQTINASAPSIGSYGWTVPDAISNTVRVRVSDPNDIGALDDSNADFRITGDFTVTAPNGTEQWVVGSVQNITWAKTGSVSNAKIEYSTNSGGTWTTIAGLTPNNGTFAWTIPDTITAQGRVRLSDPVDATANDISNADFKIKAGFTLTAPNGAEIWTVAQSRTIAWTNTGTVSLVKLELSTNGGTAYQPIQENYQTLNDGVVQNTGAYTWTVEDAISTQVRIRVSSSTDSDANDASDGNFKIQGSLTITNPNGGENFPIGQLRDISWLRLGSIANVKITYSTDAGTTYPNVIVASTPANPTFYPWTVADAPTTMARVKVEDVSDATVFDASDASFNIQGNFTISAPNGGELWSVGESRNIAWSWGGTIPNVKLTYSTNSGSTYSDVIANSAPNGVGSSGTFNYAWMVPDSISSAVRVRIEDVNDANVSDVSNADFKIQGRLNIVTPNGLERWVVNEIRTISWTTAGTLPTVKLEYSTDGGATYPAGNVIVALLTNTGSYNWLVPNTVSMTSRVRVVNTADVTVSDQSDADFKIDLYKVSFRVRDLLTNNHLDQLTVSAGTPSQPGSTQPPAYTWTESGLSSIIKDKPLQYGSWSAKFSRVSYGDQTLNFVVDRDYPETAPLDVFMETQVVHIWEAVTEFAYVPAVQALPNLNPPIAAVADSLTVTSTLRRDGSTVTGPVLCQVDIYDGATLIQSFVANGPPNALGFYSSPQYNFTWSPTSLTAGKVYSVVTTINIATGGVFKTPRTLTINVEQKLQDVKHEVNKNLDVPLSQVRTDIQGTLDTFTHSISTSISTLDTAAKNSQTASNTLISAANQSQATANDLRTVANQQSAKLLTPQEINTGLPLIIRWRGPRDTQGLSLSPKITIENFDKIAVVSEVAMQPISGAQNLFEWSSEWGLAEQVITATKFQPGKTITVTVKDDAIGSFQVGTIFVKRPEGRLLMKTSAKIGETISIQLAGADNWTPLIELSADGVVLTAKTPMKKVGSDGKVTTFEYLVPESVGSLVPIGKSVVALVTESLTGFFDQGSFQFTGTSLDDLSGQIAASSASRGVIQDTYTAVKNLQGSLGGDGQLGQKLEVLKQRIDRIPKAVAEEGSNVRMKQAINDVAERISALAGDEGYDFSQLMEMGVEKGLEKSDSIQNIRKKTDTVQGATEVMQLLMENKLGGIDDPVVHVIYQ